MNYKKRVEKSLGNFFEREAKKLDREMSGPKRKNKAPEKQVVKDILEWGKEYGFSLDVVEASTFDRTRVSMVHDTKVVAGFSDIVGCTPKFGFACYIEAKAPKSRARLKEHQRAFLEKKINAGAFACVTDSIEHLHNLYHQWIVLKLKVRELSVLRPQSFEQAGAGSSTALLLNDLPKRPVKRNKPKRDPIDDLF